MPIKVTCGQGDHILNVPDNMAGRKVRCPRCQAVVLVPAAQPPMDSPAPATTIQHQKPPSQPVRKPAQARKGGGSWKWPLVACAALVVVLGAGAAGYFVFFKGKEMGPNPANDRDAVRATATRFLEAMKGPKSAILPLLTDKARESVSLDKGFKIAESVKVRPGVIVQIGEAVFTGDEADVPVTLREAGKDAKLVLHMRRQGSDWRIRGLGFEIIPGEPLLDMDMENPKKMVEDLFPGFKPPDLANMRKNIDAAVEDAMKGKPRPEDLDNEALTALDPSAFEATWKGNLAVQDRPALAALQELAKAFDFKLETTPEQERALARPIAVKLDGRSRHERIDAVCRQAGFYPVYPDVFSRMAEKPSVRLKQLPRSHPVAFAGPFLVEIEELNEYAPHASGLMGLRVVTAGLPTIASRMLDEEWNSLLVSDVVDAKGRTLHDPSPRSTAGKMSKKISGGYERSFNVGLKNLLRDVTAIKTVSGTIRLPLPVRVDSVRFESLRAGTVQKVGAAEVKLAHVSQREENHNGKKYPQQRYTFEYKGVGPRQVKMVAYDDKKQLRSFPHTSWSGSDKEGRVDFTVPGPPPAVLVVKVVTVGYAEYKFRLDDVPLTSAERMPEKLTPAAFPGHDAPLSLEFVRVIKANFPSSAQFRITNHADKPIRTIYLKLDYLDATGKRLGGRPHEQHTAPLKPEQKDLPLVVAKNAMGIIEVNTSFQPANTKSVKAVPIRVVFADATEWAAGK